MKQFFTVLISVYYKENHTFLRKALDSLVNQTVLPEKIVVVKDGKLTVELDETLADFSQRYPDLFLITGYEKNRGLGEALNFGLGYVKTPWVARMDADDVAVLERFEIQTKFLEDHQKVDVLGSYLAEFEVDEHDAHRVKEVPVTHEEILKVAQLFNPVNHMTVFIKTKSLIAAGGYLHAPYFEDYYLWVRMLSLGMRFHNLPKSLVYGRVGNDMVGKRHGWQYMNYEHQHFRRMKAMKFISQLQYYKALALRLPLRLIPKSCLAAIYGHTLRRKKNDTSSAPLIN